MYIMGVDSEPIRITKVPDAIGNVFVDILSKINYKIAIFLAFIFVVLSSDVFTNRILSKFSGAVDGKHATNYGTFLQGMFLACAYIVMDALVRNQVI